MVFLDCDQAELDRQHEQRAGPSAEVIQRYAQQSKRIGDSFATPEIFSYGSSPAETFDLYKAKSPNAPIHVFIHGGAWRLLSKKDSAFPADNFVRSGAHFIALDFAQLPSVKSYGDAHTGQTRGCLDFPKREEIWRRPRSNTHFGTFIRRHLAACVAVTDWPSDFDLPRELVKSVICVSGIYDLFPVRLSARNDYVKLDTQTEQTLSPIRQLQHLSAQVFVCCGELESDEFRRQSRECAQALGSSLAAPHVELKGLNHYEAAGILADPDHGLGLAALKLMQIRR